MTEEKLRLHVTPFSNTLAQSLLSTYSSIAAASISLHTLETLPGHSYGFLELSAIEGEMLKKKLHGSILKGKKLQIEHARPQKRGLEPEKNNWESSPIAEKESRPLKRTRAPGPELQGHELTPERKIKRGWTEPDNESRLRSSSSRASRSMTSKYTNKAECIFRVQLPPNKETDRSSFTRNEKTQGRKKGKKITTVHEFERSVPQPSFIRRELHTGDTGVAVEYVDGKGWVDKDGKLVEEESKSRLFNRSRTDEGQLSHNAADGNLDQAENKSVIASGDGILFDDETIERNAADEETSRKSQSVSDTESEPQEELEQIPKAESADVNNACKANSTANHAVHPLETLFKRPSQPASLTRRKRSLEIKTTFNFFETSEDPSILQTPFTTRDLQLRGLRSAAPTPDTALPTRRFFADSVSPSGKSGVDDEDLVIGPSDSSLPFGKSPQKEGPKAESDFAKWFWEHRGENNRTWKRRKREAMKEKRQRGNRQEGHRIG